MFNAISEWLDQRYKKYVNKMEEEGLCPTCRGKGFNLSGSEYFYTASYDCASCNGSGLFSDWENLK